MVHGNDHSISDVQTNANGNSVVNAIAYACISTSISMNKMATKSKN